MGQNDSKKFKSDLQQIDELIAMGLEVIGNASEVPNLPGITVGDPGEVAEWISRCHKFLTRVCGPKDSYVQEFQSKRDPNWSVEGLTERLGVLKAVRADLISGNLTTIGNRISLQKQREDSNYPEIIKAYKKAEAEEIETEALMDNSGNESVDVVIITALQKEQEAVSRYLKSIQPIKTKNRTFFKSKLVCDNGRDSYTMVLLSLPGMGNVQAAIATTQAINIWNPSHIILVGITGGTAQSGDQYLGDIVVAEQIVDYEPGKVTGAGFEHRFEVVRPDFHFIEMARNLPSAKWVFSTKVPRPDGTTGRTIPKVHIGIVASGEKVIKNSTFVEEFRSHWSKVAAIEMESYGTALAAYQSDTAPKMLMVKGICDWADEAKNDIWQDYAADVAAAFVMALLRTAPFTAKAIRPQATQRTSVIYSGKSKIMLSRRIGDNWRDLADYFDIPSLDRQRFKQGFECQDIWEWLEWRNKLEGLKDALTFIGREDLLEILEFNPKTTDNSNLETNILPNKISFPSYTSFQRDLENLIQHAIDNFESIRERIPDKVDDAGYSNYITKFSFEYSTNNTIWKHNGKWYFTCTFCKDMAFQQAETIFNERVQEIKLTLCNEWKFEEREKPESLHRKEFEAVKKYNLLRIRMTIAAYDSGKRSQVDFTLEQLEH
jgi:nucleoside phosphorylase